MANRVVGYDRYLSTFGSADGHVTFNQPLTLKPNGRRVAIRVISATISRLVANVFDMSANGGTRNNLIQVSRDAGASWVDVVLPPGAYGVSNINAAIKDATNGVGWNTLAAEPALQLFSNSVVQRCYWVLDSTRLAAPGTQIGVRMNGGTSLAGALLGFSAAQTSVADGTFGGDVVPRIDWIGNSVSVRLRGFGPLSVINGTSNDELMQIALGTPAGNIYSAPQAGVIMPWITIPSAGAINGFDVAYIGATGDPVYFIEGQATLRFEIAEQ
jgi:hypothetical protein